MIPLLILFVLIGLLMIVLALPLILGKVPPNTWYGFRIRLTLDYPKIWYPANRRAGWLLLIVGVVNIVAAVLLLVLVPRLTEDAYGLWMSAIMLASLLPCLILSVRYARHLAADGGRSAVRDVGQASED